MIVEHFLLHISERKRLTSGQRRVLRARGSNLVFYAVEFGLQFFEVAFEFRRFLFMGIGSEIYADQLLGESPAAPRGWPACASAIPPVRLR